MNFSRIKIRDQKGAAAVEFAILLPIWLMIFFALLDYSWYLTNLMVMENAVTAGARAGVKVKYWSDADDENPIAIAKETVRKTFWLDPLLTDEMIDVYVIDRENKRVNLAEAEYKEYKHLEVRVKDFEYPLFVGYLSASMLPRTIRAASLMAFP